MPIPPFNSIWNVLPPHLGDPTNLSHVSPYLCTVKELCQRFSTSNERKVILDGFLKLREELFRLGVNGFQWLGGSFMEDVETHSKRPPRDIDVVTWVEIPASREDLSNVVMGLPELWSPAQTKAKYHVDHYIESLDCSLPPRPRSAIVEMSKYWYALFSHRRDGLWKGMLITGLLDKSDDDEARKVLGAVP